MRFPYGAPKTPFNELILLLFFEGWEMPRIAPPARYAATCDS
jgi:hypothetical protein